MAVNKPVKKGTRQTEERSKGLIGYKNGRQVNSSKDLSVGNYKASKGRSGKTLNLTKKQLGAGGNKAAATRKIAISRTNYDSASKKVLGPMGKPITGRVDLGGGNIAVYKNGVRVRAASAKPQARPAGPSAGKPKGGYSKGTPMRPVPKTGTPMRPVPKTGTPMRPVPKTGNWINGSAGGGGGGGRGGDFGDRAPGMGSSKGGGAYNRPPAKPLRPGTRGPGTGLDGKGRAGGGGGGGGGRSTGGTLGNLIGGARGNLIYKPVPGQKRGQLPPEGSRVRPKPKPYKGDGKTYLLNAKNGSF